MIYSINKGESKTISVVALNSSGGLIDLTAATITVAVKQFGNASTTLFTKSSSNTSEIEKLNSTKGIYLLKITSGNTSSLSDRTLYCLQTIVVGSDTHTRIFYIKIKGNGVSINGATVAVSTEIRHGTTAERIAYGLTLTSADRVSYFDDTDNSAYWWNGTGWS